MPWVEAADRAVNHLVSHVQWVSWGDRVAGAVSGEESGGQLRLLVVGEQRAWSHVVTGAVVELHHHHQPHTTSNQQWRSQRIFFEAEAGAEAELPRPTQWKLGTRQHWGRGSHPEEAEVRQMETEAWKTETRGKQKVGLDY